MAESYTVARGDRSGLPKAVTVGCFVLGKVEGAPMYVRALNKDVALCIALRDDTCAWIGWAAVRVKTPGIGDGIPERGHVGMLARVMTQELWACAQALSEEISTGMREHAIAAPGSWKAMQKMRGKRIF